MSTTVATSRAYGAAVAENVVAALNSMGAQPQGCYGMEAGVPTLALDFLTQELDQRITFSRADGSGKATRVNSAGLIETVPVNLLLQSSQLDTSWSATRCTPTESGTSSTGSKRWLITTDGTATTHAMGQSITFVSGVTYTFSFEATAGSFGFMGVLLPVAAFASNPLCYFNVAGGVVGSVSGTATSAISSLGGGRYRCSVTAVATASAAGNCLFYITDSGSNTTTAAVAGTIYLANMQIEAGSVATTYIPTTTAASGAPRFDYDPVTLAPRGLLIEESRANLEFQSTLVGVTGVTFTGSQSSPDGGTGATLITADGTVAEHSASGNTATQTAQAYCISSYIKAGTSSFVQLTCSASLSATAYANFQLSGAGTANALGGSTAGITDCGNGWYRVWMSYTSLAAGPAAELIISIIATINDTRRQTQALSTNLYVFGRQVELGAFPTSYIPTTTAAVTRAADVASMTGTNFSSWFNATEGTFVAGFDTAYTTSGSSCGVVGCGTNARFAYTNTGSLAIRSYDGTTVLNSANSVTNNVPSKVASGYTAGVSRSICTAGATVATTATCAAPYTAGSTLYIGNVSVGVEILNGHLQRLTYYNKRLPDATLKAISA